MALITIIGAAEDLAGDAWANALVEIRLAEASTDEPVTALTDAAGAFSVLADLTGEGPAAAVFRLPDGSEFTFALDPGEEEIDVGLLKTSIEVPTPRLTPAASRPELPEEYELADVADALVTLGLVTVAEPEE